MLQPFVSLQSNLLLCWHGFCDVNVTLSKSMKSRPSMYGRGWFRGIGWCASKLTEHVYMICLKIGGLCNGSFFSSPEPKAHWWANSIPVTPASVVRPSVVRQHFQTSSPLKLLGQLNSYFICRLLRMGERKFVQMALVTWPRWPPRPYMVKPLKKSSSPEPEGRWPWDLVCSIGVVGPTKFVQMMILGWPWPT